MHKIQGEFHDFTNNILLGQGDVVKDLQKARLECENLKRQMLQQEINFNIQKTEALTRYLSQHKILAGSFEFVFWIFPF